MLSLLGRVVPRLLAVLLVGMGLVVAVPSTAGAHADLASSSPAQGATATGPLEEASLTFTAPVDPVVDRFELVDGSGASTGELTVEPQGDGSEVVVRPAEPVPAGGYVLTWAIKADDGHPITGSVAFAVEVPVAATVEQAAPEVPTLPAAVEAGGSSAADAGAALLRALAFGGLLVAVGAMAFLSRVFEGSPTEARRLVFLVRRAAVVCAGAALLGIPFRAAAIDGSALLSLAPGSLIDAMEGWAGLGVVARVAGAGLILRGLHMDLVPVRPTTRAMATAGGAAMATRPHPSWVRVRLSAEALLGAALLLVSGLFFGHTLTEGPRWLVAASDLAHVAAGAVWAGGLVSLALLLQRRRRRGEPLDAALGAARFSTLAAASLATVAVTGLVLGWAILGGPGGLVGTAFGRILLVKVLAVAALAGLGAYNHRVLVPALVDGAGEATSDLLRRTVTAEVALVGVIVVLTGFLVRSSAIAG